MTDMTKDEALRCCGAATNGPNGCPVFWNPGNKAIQCHACGAVYEALSRPAAAPGDAEVDHKRLWRLTDELRPLLQDYGQCWERQAPYAEAERSGSPMEALEEDLDQYERPIIEKVDALITAERDRQAEEIERLREALTNPLTEDEDEWIDEEANKNFRKATSGVRGQMMRPSDHLDWHVARATQRCLQARALLNKETG